MSKVHQNEEQINARTGIFLKRKLVTQVFHNIP